MKRLLLLAGMLLAFDVQSDAFDTGNDLFRNCVDYEKAMPTVQAGNCIGFVSAVSDVIGDFGLQGTRACFPKQVTKGQSIAVVMKYLRERPEALHLAAASLAANALILAFPCSK